MGREQPRLFTPPDRRLTKKTSLGPLVIEFAEDILGITLLPWQRFWLLHALELDRNGDFRFRTILTLIARQNGKTTLLAILALAFIFLGRARLVLGAAQSLDIAREAWDRAVEMAQGVPDLDTEIESVKRLNGEQAMQLTNRCRYRIAANTERAARGLSVDLLILDELRTHRDWAGWGALSKTTIARPNALTIGLSNAGDDRSIVLNSLRDAALAGTDPTLGLFEWSAPDNCDLDDPDALAQANPGLGHTITLRALHSALATDPPEIFRSECLCQRVDALDAAINTSAWQSSADPGGTLDGYRDRIALGVDVAPDSAHVTLVAAALGTDDRYRAEVVAAWTDTEQARAELPDLIDRIQPQAIAWFPSGPGNVIGQLLRPLGAHELKGTDVAEACMTLADLVAARRIIHPGDPLLDTHAAGASKLHSGDGWRFARRGAGHVDAVYALAAAVRAAATLPAPRPKPRLILPSNAA